MDVLDSPLPRTSEEAEAILVAVAWSLNNPPRRRALGRRSPPAPAVLAMLDSATTYYHGHDDWFFWVESRSDRLPKLVLRRLLAVRAASAWQRQQVTLPDPDDTVAARLLEVSREWMGELAATSPESVSIALFPVAGRGQRLHRKPAYVAAFDTPSQTWELRRAVR